MDRGRWFLVRHVVLFPRNDRFDTEAEREAKQSIWLYHLIIGGVYLCVGPSASCVFLVALNRRPVPSPSTGNMKNGNALTESHVAFDLNRSRQKKVRERERVRKIVFFFSSIFVKNSRSFVDFLRRNDLICVLTKIYQRWRIFIIKANQCQFIFSHRLQRKENIPSDIQGGKKNARENKREENKWRCLFSHSFFFFSAFSEQRSNSMFNSTWFHVRIRNEFRRLFNDEFVFNIDSLWAYKLYEWSFVIITDEFILKFAFDHFDFVDFMLFRRLFYVVRTFTTFRSV